MITEEKKHQLAGYTISVFAFSEMGQGKIENQDSFGVYADKKQLIVAVADGLGSAAYSKEGSQKIVSVAIDVLSHTDSYETASNDILLKWKPGIEGNINQYDTTLKFVKITKQQIVYGGIGDGWIAFSGLSGLQSLTTVGSFSNQTDSILSVDLNRKFIVKETDITSIQMGLISTDGFSEDVDKEKAKQMLDDLDNELSVNEQAFIKEITQTLENWPVETNRDDKTVIFIRVSKGDN